jgi:hypothetical protein
MSDTPKRRRARPRVASSEELLRDRVCWLIFAADRTVEADNLAAGESQGTASHVHQQNPSDNAK